MSLTFDRKTFFDAARDAIFHGLSPGQVAGCGAILDEAERRRIADTRHVAYILATAFWETAKTMQPIREIGEGRGRAYGARDPETGQVYYGRGLVQLTWKANYRKMAALCGADLVGDPDLALTPAIATKILIEGMFRGSFTGKRLDAYFNAAATDWVGARRIINGTDQAETIAAIARAFEAALRSSLQAPAALPVPSAAPAASAPSLVDRLERLIGLTP